MFAGVRMNFIMTHIANRFNDKMIFFVISFIMMIDICLFRAMQALKRFYIRQFSHFNSILNGITGFISIWIFCIIVFMMFVYIDFPFFAKTILSFGISSSFAIIIATTILFSFWAITPFFLSQVGRFFAFWGFRPSFTAFVMGFSALFCLPIFLLSCSFARSALVRIPIFSGATFRKFINGFGLLASATSFHKVNYTTGR